MSITQSPQVTGTGVTYSIDASGNIQKLTSVLAQTAIPLVFPGNSIVNADGTFYSGSSIGGGTLTLSSATAGSGLTATLSSAGPWAAGTWSVASPFSQAYPDAWVYLPASALVSGVAGLYYAHFTTTTSATIYQAYALPSTTTPFIPYDADLGTTLTPVVGTGTTFTQTQVATKFMNIPLPANSLGMSGSLRATIEINNNPTTTNKTIQVGLGTAVGNIVGDTLNTTDTFARIMGMMRNRNSLTAQYSINNNLGYTTSAGTLSQTTIDTTIQQPIMVTLTIPQAATDQIVIEGLLIEILPSS